MKHSLLLLLLPLSMVPEAHGMSVVPDDSTHRHEKNILLEEIEVTGITGTQCLKQAAAPFTVVTSKDIQHISTANIINAVTHQPGIAQVTTGASISKPVIRGLGYNRVVVVDGGIRQEGQQWGDEHGIEVDGDNVWSVEVLKGPASLMYGSDAIAGVMILHPAPALPSGEINGSVSSEYHTNNGLWNNTVNVAGNTPLSSVNFVWDARYSDKRAHAYKNKYDGYVAGSQFKEQDLNGMIGLRYSQGQNLLRASWFHLVPGIVEGERDEQTGELEWPDDMSHRSYQKMAPYQKVDHLKIVSDNNYYFDAGTLKYTFGYQRNSRKEFEDIDEYGLHMLLHTLNYDIAYRLSNLDGWRLAAGVNGMWQQSLNKGTEFLIPDYHLFDIGTYVSAERQMGRLNLSAGMRYDSRSLSSDQLIDEGEIRFTSLSRRFNALTGSLGVVFNVNNEVDIRMNLSRGFRAPTISELSSNGVHEGSLRYEVGASDLRPEYSLQCDFGFNYTGKQASLQVALFLNRISNYIFTRKQQGVQIDGFDTYRYRQGDACLMGGEITLDVHPISQLHINNSFGLVMARQLHVGSDERYLPLIPEPRWNCDVRYQFPRNFYAQAQMEQHFRQSHFYAADDTETATPAYTLINIGAGWSWKQNSKTRFSIDLSVNNLFDRAYQNHLSRLKYADLNTVTGRRGVFNIGRNIVIKITAPF